MFAGKRAEYQIGWCERSSPSYAVEQQFMGERPKRPKCGASTTYSLLASSRRQATANSEHTNRSRGTIEGVGDGNVEKDFAEHGGLGGSGRAATVDVVLDVAFDEAPDRPVSVNQPVTFAPMSVNQPVTCVNQPVISWPFSAPNRGQRAE